jgi:hypothetical protein
MIDNSIRSSHGVTAGNTKEIIRMIKSMVTEFSSGQMEELKINLSLCLGLQRPMVKRKVAWERSLCWVIKTREGRGMD